jgi:hypothetical protein
MRRRKADLPAPFFAAFFAALLAGVLAVVAAVLFLGGIALPSRAVGSRDV